MKCRKQDDSSPDCDIIITQIFNSVGKSVWLILTAGLRDVYLRLVLFCCSKQKVLSRFSFLVYEYKLDAVVYFKSDPLCRNIKHYYGQWVTGSWKKSKSIHFCQYGRLFLLSLRYQMSVALTQQCVTFLKSAGGLFAINRQKQNMSCPVKSH